MYVLVDCPHCLKRVLPTEDRRCRACLRDVDATPEEGTPGQVARAASGIAAKQMQKGCSPSEIRADLVRRGLNAEAAAAVVDDLKRARGRARREEGQLNMLAGALWFFAGLAVTVVSYRTAVAAGGCWYFFARGAMVFGVIAFVRGLIKAAG